MKIVLLVVALLLNATVVWSAGIGDTFAEFEHTWNKGFRQEFKQGGGVKDVYVGHDKKHSISYSVGMNDFAGRVGDINGEAWGLFGASVNSLPTTKQFMSGIKTMMPADSRLIEKYSSSDSGWLKEIYVFKSTSLASKPGVGKALGYYMDAKSVGKFFLVVNHNIDDRRFVMNFHIFLGDGSNDASGMKKVKAGM